MTEARLIVENFVDSMTHLMELLIKETSILNDKDFDGLNQSSLASFSYRVFTKTRKHDFRNREIRSIALTKRNVRICVNYIKNLGAYCRKI